MGALAKIERKAMEGRGCWCAVLRYTCTNTVATILNRVGAVVSSLGDLSSDLPPLSLFLSLPHTRARTHIHAHILSFSLSSDQFRSSSEARLT